MTEQGLALTWECYGPLVDEGPRLLGRLSLAELKAMRTLLDDMRTVTDDHRARVSGGSEG